MRKKKTSTTLKAIEIRSIKDCRRLLSRIIRQYQLEEIDEKKSKTLAYLCTQYAHLYEVEKIEELEKKLEQFENRIG